MQHRSQPAISAEMALLVACADTAIGDQGVRRLRELAVAGVRGQELLEQAEWHNMLPLLYRNLQTCCADEVPSEVLTSLREQSFGIAARNLYMSHELGNVLALLEAQGIRGLAFKGPVLAVQVYGDLSSRSFIDLDILVPERDMPAVRALLAARGYHPVQLLSAAVESAAGQGIGQLNLLGNGIAIDLHWRLAPPIFPLGPDLERVWQRSVRLQMGGIDVQTLSAEDTLLFLCCHGAKHLWDTLESIVAVGALVRQRHSIDLEAVLAEARRRHCERVVLLGLLLAYRLCRVPLPPAIVARANADRAVRMLLTRLCRPLLAGERLRSGRLAHAGLSLLMYDRNRDRARHCLQLATRPQDTDLVAMPLPVSLHALYSAFRPIRLAAKYARSGIRRLRTTISGR